MQLGIGALFTVRIYQIFKLAGPLADGDGHAMSQQPLDDQLLECNGTEPKRKGVVRSNEVSDVTRKKLSLKRKKGFEKDSVLSQAAPDLSTKPKPAEPSASSVVENKNPFGKVTC